MIHRLALLLGGAGAAGVLALAFAMGGTTSPLAKTADAFVPVANDLSTQQPADTTGSPGVGNTDTAKKDVHTVYVLPTPHPPKVHHGGATANSPQPTNKPRHPRADNGASQGGNEPTDDQTGGTGSSDETGGGGHPNGGSSGDGADQGGD